METLADWYAISCNVNDPGCLLVGGENKQVAGFDVAVFGRVTLLVASDQRRAWAMCQQGWDDDECPDWAAAVSYLDQYGLADVTVDHRTDWRPHSDGGDTFILRTEADRFGIPACVWGEDGCGAARASIPRWRADCCRTTRWSLSGYL